MNKPVLIYGATGYTGRLVATHARDRGLPIVVAGRDPERVDVLAASLGVPGRAFDLVDPERIVAGLDGVAAVLNVAGPFRETAEPLVRAALASGVHYLDTTAEFSVYALAESVGADAVRAGVMVMSGVGWDVVPTDSLAVHTAARVANPDRIAIALRITGGFSRGSLASAAGIGDLGALVRETGTLTTLPASETRKFDLGHGQEEYTLAPMGDSITARRSTGIGNIRVYLRTDEGFPSADSAKDGPTPEERAVGRYAALVEVTGRDGEVARSVISTSTGYTFTQHSSVEIARRVAEGDYQPGFQSPASAYGPLAASIAGTRVTDL
ncbi:saccharopine dehydrogenase NADP-binding domain-containing protein [Nocardia sp. NPDC050799]|uniref:saccharopine dehydrogenase family protein n=1 Tax=Nocardia sp. NPDC050799 TaxID=3154842 RepID=UPI0033DA405B